MSKSDTDTKEAEANSKDAESKDAKADDKEAEIVHYQVLDTSTLVPICEADGDDLALTANPAAVTCEDCKPRIPA